MATNNVAAELWETVEALKGVFGGTSEAQFSNEKLDYIAKTFGVSTGMHPYDLSPVVEYLQPTFSPLRNRMPRFDLEGANMQFKSVTNVDTGNVSGVVAEGKISPALTTQFADVTTQFKTYGVSSDPVTFEQLYIGRGKPGSFNVDSRAIASANLLKGMFIKEERMMLGGIGASTQISTVNNGPVNGLVYSIGGLLGNAPAGGTLGTSTTGGSIAASTALYAKYVAVTSVAIATGMPTNGGVIPYSSTQAGQSLPQSATLTVTTGAGTTNTVTFTPPQYAGPGAVIAWVLYLGTASGGPFYYAGYTTGAPLTITSIPTTGQQAPTTDQSAITSVSGGTGSSVEGCMNGVLPWLYGTGSGATIDVVNGAWTLNAINTDFQNAFQNAFADPDEFWCNAHDLGTLTSLVKSNQPYYFAAPQGGAQGELTGNFRISDFLNPVTKRIMPVNVHAYLPQGTAMALTTQLPAWYVGNNVPDVWIWGGVMDYLEVDYEPSNYNPQWLSEIKCVGAVHCFLPSQNIVWGGISA